MRFLLDTCTFLWWATGDKRLPPDVRDYVTDPDNDVYLSAVSAWEISLKHRLGRMPLPEVPEVYVPDRRRRLGIEPLPFDEIAACHTRLLPDHHRDPFDRALVAQAIVEGLVLLTPDDAVRCYPVRTQW